MFERFTDQSRRAVVLAQEEARRLGHNYIGTGHLLLGLMSQDDSVAVQVLGGLGADLEQLRARAIAEIGARPEDLEHRPSPRPRRAQRPDAAQRLLDTIEDRLSAIERHLGITQDAERPAEAGHLEAEAGRPHAEAGRPQAEVARLQAEVARLRALLREHDIDPGDPGDAPAAG